MRRTEMTNLVAWMIVRDMMKGPVAYIDESFTIAPLPPAPDLKQSYCFGQTSMICDISQYRRAYEEQAAKRDIPMDVVSDMWSQIRTIAAVSSDDFFYWNNKYNPPIIMSDPTTPIFIPLTAFDSRSRTRLRLAEILLTIDDESVHTYANQVLAYLAATSYEYHVGRCAWTDSKNAVAEKDREILNHIAACGLEPVLTNTMSLPSIYRHTIGSYESSSIYNWLVSRRNDHVANLHISREDIAAQYAFLIHTIQMAWHQGDLVFVDMPMPNIVKEWISLNRIPGQQFVPFDDPSIA